MIDKFNGVGLRDAEITSDTVYQIDEKNIHIELTVNEGGKYYFGDIDWDRHAETKNWYAKMKSRPSFRELLADQIPGLPAAAHYGNLDF